MSVVHRVYQLDRTRARELFDTRLANVIPGYGLVEQPADREVGHGVAHATPVALAREDPRLIQDPEMFRDVLLRQ